MTDFDAAAHAAGAYRIGDIIADKYRLEAMLGEGGQALVFRARNLSLDAEVAIKLVHPDAENRTQTHRLLREARAAAQLGHPGIVRIFDLGETSTGDPFLVMELLSGEDLASHLGKQRAMSPALAVRTLLPIADALVAAHGRGMVHRDLKPANVFLAENDGRLQPKLLDFGIVKMQRTSPRPESITNEGMVIGSLAYLSPEQARGFNDVDERADIWCFCAMLYECVTGDTPFHASTYDKLLRSIVNDEVTPLREHGVTEEELWALIRRGLSKSPDDRWPSMRELGRALSIWLKERGVHEDVCGVSLESRWLREQEHAPSAPDPGASTMPPAPEQSHTEASFSSRRTPRTMGLGRRHWIALGGFAGFVAVLGFGVDRVIDAHTRAAETSHLAQSANTHRPAVAGKSVPSAISPAAAPAPRPIAVPEPIALPLAPAAPSPVKSSATAPSARPKVPSRVNASKSPRQLAAPVQGPPGPKATTDLLDPY